MSVVASPDVVDNLCESCEIDRVHAWELYEQWTEDNDSLLEDDHAREVS